MPAQHVPVCDWQWRLAGFPAQVFQAARRWHDLSHLLPPFQRGLDCLRTHALEERCLRSWLAPTTGWPVAILFRNHGDGYRPANAERWIVETCASRGTGGVELRGHIIHLGPILESLVSMSALLGQIQHATILRTQLCAVPLAVGWGVGPKVEYYVEHGSSGAAHQFGFECRLHLEMHAANSASTDAEAHVRLDWQEVDPVLRKLLGAPCTEEPPPIVLVGSWVDQPRTGDPGFREPHAAILPSRSFGTSDLSAIASRLTNLKDRSIPNLPIRPPIIEGLQAPVFQRPSATDRNVAVVNLPDQIRDWFPAQVESDFCPNIQIDPGNKQIAPRLDQAHDIAEACFRGGRLHMAEKPVCHHDVLRVQRAQELRIASVAAEPMDAFLETRFDMCFVALHFKHGLHFRRRHAFKNGRDLIPTGVTIHIP